MHSATKFISGHSDVMAGVLAIKGERFDCKVFYALDTLNVPLYLILFM